MLEVLLPKLLNSTVLHVITTASREETHQWSKEMGAEIVLNHKNDLSAEFEKYEISEVDYIFLYLRYGPIF
ncbi:zinc-binding dehydrogenase [Staphylococcus gallinarum]|uniref:Zinc-binding dehydrogenase n=1 Tax=Staphylococcus gallinarum TaxID=1293 RepID=A0A380FM21_STAGA|nr:zinc-binding dehydrogenase [Staphylococcus gallinarum]